MKDIAVICCIYNNLELAKECIMEAMDRMDSVGQLILINNHSLDPRVQTWLDSLNTTICRVDRLTIVDPGHNLGCHRGFNRGMEDLLPEIKYVVKLDDDTFLRTPFWDIHMRGALIVERRVAYVSADIDPNAKQQNKYEIIENGGHKFEITAGGIVGFSCVMFRRSDLERWGPMRGAHEPSVGGNGLYGGEEAHYANVARSEGLLVAHFPGVYCDHASNEKRHPDYPMWKWLYGYRRWIDCDMAEWLKDTKNVLILYRKRLMEELRQDPMNVDFVEYTVQRIGKLGNEADAKRLGEICLYPAIVNKPKLKEMFVAAALEINSRK